MLAADIAGYTRLMEQDTNGTVAAWHDARANVIDPQISARASRIVKYSGDGFLVEFPNYIQLVHYTNEQHFMMRFLFICAYCGEHFLTAKLSLSLL